MEKNNNTHIACGSRMTIKDCIHLIRERAAALSQIIRTIIEGNEQFNKEYYDCRVSIQLDEYSVNDDYIACDVFARYVSTKSNVVYLDSIFLNWTQIDNDAEILKEVRNFIGRVCKAKSK